MEKRTCNKFCAGILKSVESISKAGISGKNTSTVINEYAVLGINYYIRAAPLEYADYLRIDDDVRKLLVRHNVHLQLTNTERLYLPRMVLGRGLCSVEQKSETIELQLFKVLFNEKHTSQEELQT